MCMFDGTSDEMDRFDIWEKYFAGKLAHFVFSILQLVFFNLICG